MQSSHDRAGVRRLKESVELTFVYQVEGCGKTQAKINDTIPHTRIDMGYGYAERDLPQVSIRK